MNLTDAQKAAANPVETVQQLAPPLTDRALSLEIGGSEYAKHIHDLNAPLGMS